MVLGDIGGAGNPAALGFMATLIAAAFGAGLLFWRSTNAQIRANAKLATAQADKTEEERRGVATDNAKDLIALMESVMSKQNARFELEVGQMKVQADHMTTASLRDKETIDSLRQLLNEATQRHESAMAAERERCDMQMAELHLRIDLLTKKVESNSTRLTDINVGGSGLLDTPVIITHAEPQ